MHVCTHTSHLPHLLVQLVHLQLQWEAHSVSWRMTVLRAGLKRVELYVQIKEEEANIRPYGRPKDTLYE